MCIEDINLGFYEKYKINKIASMQSGRCVFLTERVTVCIFS